MLRDDVASTAVVRRRVLRHWPLLPASALLLTSVAVAARAITAVSGGRFIYALDDAYIHMAMARNLAEHGVWGCTPFRFSSASSSPLWTVVLALTSLVTGTHELTPLALNLIFGVATLAVADAVLRRLSAPALLRAGALVAIVLVVPLPAMALMGMEHVLHLLLTIAFGGGAALVLAAAPGDARTEGRRTAGLCVLAALLATSRYEGLFLVGLVATAGVALGQWRRGVAVGAAGVLPVGIFGLVSMALGSLFLPNSLMLKAGGDAASTWTVLFRPIGAADIAFLLKDHPLLWLVAGAAVVTVAEWWRARTLRRVAVLVPLLLTLMVALHVHFALSSTFWVYRYDAYLLGFGVFAVAVAGAGAGTLLPAAPRWVPAVLAAAVVMASVAVLGDARQGLEASTEIASASLTYREHYEAAQFVRQTHPGETVLVNDAGAMAYFANANMVDIFGLCDIEPVRLRRAGPYDWVDVEAWTLPYQPSLAILQLSWGWVTERVPPDWQKVAEVNVLPEGQKLGFFSPTHDAGAAARLRAEVRRFYQPLAGPLGYRVRVY